MNSEARVERALKSFRGGYGCAQSVMLAYSDIYSEELTALLKISSGFGGGMGRLQSYCGALTAIFMIAGMEEGSVEPGDDSKDILASVIQEATLLFEEMNGSSDCYQLIDLDLNNADERQLHKEGGIRQKVCEKCVESAVQIVDIISLHKKEIANGEKQ